ncbi:hypothetical protein AYO20_09677 [Fonsecaea nubica]|uniref:NADH:flavin oxidoreductase/NADH oxidase N-terminal domain-containing protein n=1 Tax=Fonsecaea nubica TaxID=856822 RepID=A0A178CEP8_9EURO|nr:hypothetical protein AYO20_09677 [Fonsecaea nubica]OAL27824.1 hypothetical protein AYO20_09677 [Fonsecaea nubica]
MSGYVESFKAPTELFTPLHIGRYQLAHRIILAPCTRCRSPAQVPGELNAEYYSQRATPGGLLITEATFISERAGAFARVPGIFTSEHIRGWKTVTDAVHRKGGYIFLQLWHTGRCPPDVSPYPPLSSSNKRLEGCCPFNPNQVPFAEPKPMTIEDMHQVCQDYAKAAANAVEAGFDGVEIHAANGYLVDQFLCDNINDRTDEFGGSIENRARFPLMIFDALIASIGADRVGIRLSPFGNVHGAADSDPHATWGYVCRELEKRHVAYVHLVEPRHHDLFQTTEQKLKFLEAAAARMGREVEDALTLRPFKKALGSTPIIVAGGGLEVAVSRFADHEADGLAFGRFFIANPDLPHRLKHGLPLNRWDRTLFYTPGPRGYTDYPTA